MKIQVCLLVSAITLATVTIGCTDKSETPLTTPGDDGAGKVSDGEPLPQLVADAALEAVPGGTVVGAEREEEGGVMVYEVEISRDGQMFEVELDEAGNILEIEEEGADGDQGEGDDDDAQNGDDDDGDDDDDGNAADASDDDDGDGADANQDEHEEGTIVE